LPSDLVQRRRRELTRSAIALALLLALGAVVVWWLDIPLKFFRLDVLPLLGVMILWQEWGRHAGTVGMVVVVIAGSIAFSVSVFVFKLEPTRAITFGAAALFVLYVFRNQKE
jgi:hypothetical protein